MNSVKSRSGLSAVAAFLLVTLAAAEHPPAADRIPVPANPQPTADAADHTTSKPVPAGRQETDPHAAQQNHHGKPAALQQDPLRLLKDGNCRFVADAPRHEHQDAAWRRENAAHGQHPFALILSCADSRVPPEVVFDQGLGDLFVVRVAGNVCTPEECGSVEYAIGHLHVPLIVVMGHTKCGAVSAAVERAEGHGSVPELLHHIEPAVEAAKAGKPADKAALIAAAVRENVWLSISNLIGHSAEIRSAIQMDGLRVIGAVYDLETGKVQWLGPHPNQSGLTMGSTADGWHADSH